MGVRETLNKQPALTTGATIAIILIALIFIIWQVTGSNHPSIPTKAYFTVDDGASYFKDDINLIPPVDHDGKPEVKADVFKCPGGSPFVGYLERYSADAKKVIDDSRGKPNQGDPGRAADAASRGLEVKAPLTGDQGWLKNYLPAASKVVTVHCPGSDQQPEPVMP